MNAPDANCSSNFSVSFNFSSKYKNNFNPFLSWLRSVGKTKEMRIFLDISAPFPYTNHL